MKTDSSKWQIAYVLSEVGRKSLNLRPDFQRFYIWDRRKEEAFIDSVLRQYPVPPIWLWKHKGTRGRTIYEVIDGQQRLTCIKKFVENDFRLKSPSDAPDRDSLKELDGLWFTRAPGKKGLPPSAVNRFMDYLLPYIEVETDDRELVIDIFRRLNKSSTNLTPQELRHAFFAGKFKQSVYEITARFQAGHFWGGKDKVFAPSASDRMATQQFVSDLYVAMIEGKSQDRSQQLDEYYERYDKVWRRRSEVEREFAECLKAIKHILPGPSRFTKNQSDFYSLFLLISLYRSSKEIVLDEDCITGLRTSLLRFEADYTKFLDQRGSEATGQQVFESYRETIVGRQREKEMRELRLGILDRLLRPGLSLRDNDPQRLFSDEQRRYLWQTKAHVCAICKSKIARYEDYEPDHIHPHSKGGRTTIANGQLTHGVCNKKKGASTRSKS